MDLGTSPGEASPSTPPVVALTRSGNINEALTDQRRPQNNPSVLFWPVGNVQAFKIIHTSDIMLTDVLADPASN